MSESGSTKWILIGCVVLALLGSCCVGVSAVAWFAYVREQERETDARYELELEERRLAEEEYERRRAEAERREMEERQAAVQFPSPLDVAPEPSRDRSPRHIEATITRAEGVGAVGLPVGTSCEFDVTVHDRQNVVGYWCRALVECGGVRIYGEDRPDGTGNGYFDCALFHTPLGVAGEDRDTSAAGGDPFFQIDTRAGQLVVIDDDQTTLRPGPYSITAGIQRIR